MPARRNTWILLVPSAVVALAALAWTFVPWLPAEDTAIARRVGREMAKETLRLRKGPGRLVVWARDTSEFPQPSVEAALGAFLDDLADAQVKPDVLRRLPVDPLRQVQVPPGDFVELLRRGKDGDVIVSFMGPPLLGPEAMAAVGAPRAKVVAFCPGYVPRYVDLRMLARQGLVHGGVVARVDAAGETFEGQYQPWQAAITGGKP